VSVSEKYLSLTALLSRGKKGIMLLTTPRLVPVTHIRTNMTIAGMMRERFLNLIGRRFAQITAETKKTLCA
jgi:hypothetical protein